MQLHTTDGSPVQGVVYGSYRKIDRQVRFSDELGNTIFVDGAEWLGVTSRKTAVAAIVQVASANERNALLTRTGLKSEPRFALVLIARPRPES
jgi:hypothetical protein